MKNYNPDIIGKSRYVWTAVLVYGLILTGCAGVGDDPKTSNAIAAGSGQVEYAEQMPYPMKDAPFTFRPNPDYSVIGKPTRIVETPQGQRHVYDPARDPEIINRYRAAGTFQRYVTYQSRLPQVKELSNLGCKKFKDYCQSFGYGVGFTFNDQDAMCAAPQFNGYKNDADCQLAMTGVYGWNQDCKLCRPSQSNPDNLPMHAQCFAQRVRVECVEWDQ